MSLKTTTTIVTKFCFHAAKKAIFDVQCVWIAMRC